jgi:hypothetical protein
VVAERRPLERGVNWKRKKGNEEGVKVLAFF